MEFPLLLTVLLVVTVLLPSFVDSAIQYKDQNNQYVDWFIVYKLPKISKSQYPLVREGLGHLYMDVHCQSWTMSTVSLEQRNHAIAYTLQQIYDNYESKKVAYALYNDAPPNKQPSPLRGTPKVVWLLIRVLVSGWCTAFPNSFHEPEVHTPIRIPGNLMDKHFSVFLSGSASICEIEDINKEKLERQIVTVPKQRHFNPINLNLNPDVFTKDNLNLSDVLKNDAHVTKAPYKKLLSFKSLAGQVFIHQLR
ncbi:hypothetical protein CAPTEDRAFT_194443 [Capitella teleta]|uniref:Uncharacterized protein n=1 Tax=Capitella teleta TaxID=283909 RepID=R7UTS0_CAPTE|nr:hypothetical protein CAPTEDRAFT_194443 [Capitella teleta]|eukprot:ELU06801.1 hypothetical protein CAPTEDRAFT_194443 [Capitella teleta]